MLALVLAALAIPDAEGKRLIALDSVAEPAQLTRATCEGKLVPVRFVAVQPRGPKDTGRVTKFKFDQLAGAVYEVTQGKVNPDSTCLLESAKWFEEHVPVPVQADGKTKCDAKTAAAVAKAAGGRGVERCVKLGSFAGGDVVLTSFVPKGEALLLGVGLVTGKGVALRTHEGKADPQKFSCYRADDGCRADGSVFRVPFVLRRGADLEVFSLWDAPEGQNIELLEPKGGALEPSVSAQRYWSPE